MPTVIVHIANEDPVKGEMDNLPGLNDTLIMLKQPQRKDGKDVSYLEMGVTVVYWPVSRISFIEVLPTAEDERIVSHVKE